MKSGLSFPEGLRSSVPTLLVCPNTSEFWGQPFSSLYPHTPITSPTSVRRHPGASPPSTTFPFRTVNLIQTP